MKLDVETLDRFPELADEKYGLPTDETMMLHLFGKSVRRIAKLECGDCFDDEWVHGSLIYWWLAAKARS